LRHAHEPLLLSQGLNLKIVQERLGHESIVTTGDTYSHVTQAMSQEANRILDNVFCLSQKKVPQKYRVRRVCVKNVSNH
jgi:integrase